MAGSSNNSFIPKRQPSKHKRNTPSRRLMLVNIFTYSLMFSALLAAGGSVLYKNYTVSLLKEEVIKLDEAVNTFSVEDYRRVQEFDVTLNKAVSRLNTTASLASVLVELDRIIAQPIQIETLAIERERDEALDIKINFLTDTLDAALFQRKVLNTYSPLFSDVSITEIDLLVVTADEELQVAAGSQVGFVAEFSVPLQTIQYDPAEARRTDAGELTAESTSPPVQTNELPTADPSLDFDIEPSSATPEDIDQLFESEELEPNEIDL